MKTAIIASLALSALTAGMGFALEAEDCLILPGETVDLGGTIPGQLSFVSVEIGDEVERGQLVASLRSEVQEAVLALADLRASNSSALGAAQARLAYEASELERAESLLKRGVLADARAEEVQASHEIRLRELEQAEMEQEMSLLDLERAKAELEIRRIRAPIDGVVAERVLDGGEYLRDDGKVITIVSLDPLRVELFLDQSDFDSVAKGQTVDVYPALRSEKAHVAVVRSKDAVIDSASATFRVRLDLPNPDNLIVPGVRCHAIFSTPG